MEDGDDGGTWPADPIERAAAAAAAGLRRPFPGDAGKALAVLAASDPDGRVRSSALAALARMARTKAAPAWRAALSDPDPGVRRRACEITPAVRPRTARPLLSVLSDPDGGVAEAAAFALGELGGTAIAAGATAALSTAARSHPDPLVREAAVAALGALGDPGGVEAVLHGCSDRPAIRRRAVVALAAFEGPEVEAALERALEDHDWQVRQAAEDLLRPRPS